MNRLAPNVCHLLSLEQNADDAIVDRNRIVQLNGAQSMFFV